MEGIQSTGPQDETLCPTYAHKYTVTYHKESLQASNYNPGNLWFMSAHISLHNAQLLASIESMGIMSEKQKNGRQR